MGTRFLRAQFELTQPGFMEIRHGDIFQIFARSKSDGSLDAENIFTRKRGLIPRPSQNVYVEMIPSQISYVQPIVLIGSLRHYVQDMLLQRENEKFSTPVPHTTRPIRPSERNGVHYWFIRKTTMDQMARSGLFLEFGDINGHLYGTSEAAVRTVAQKEKKHCLMELSSNIPKLIDRKLFPIVIMVGAQNWEQLRDILQFEGGTEKQAFDEYVKDAEEIERSAMYLSGIVREPTIEDSFKKVKELIDLHSATAWLPQVSAGTRHERIV